MNRQWISRWTEIFRPLFTECVLARFVAALCITSTVSLFLNPTGFDLLAFASNIDLLVFCLTLVCLMLSLTLGARYAPFNLDAYALVVSMLMYGAVMVMRNRNFYFSLGVLMLFAFVGYYLLRDDKLQLSTFRINKKLAIGITATATVFIAVYVGGLTTLRYLNYSTSTYDFGIFAQMFYHMKDTLLPNTTCERSTLLSHFAIHLSPIFYMLLPGYWLFPSPAYLQIMQGLVVASSMIPLFLLAKRHSLSYTVTVLVCVAFSLHPALSGSCFYDIHENMFLTPLILWLLYFMDGKQWLGMYSFALFTCLVKEDAALYVACIALFLIFVRKERRHGTILLCGALVYFAGAMLLLEQMGHGTMTGRFNNFISDSDWGLLSVLKTILVNPAYLLSEIFNQEKVIYMVLMLLPVVCIPLFNRKLSHLLLIIPFLVVNLMSDYPYQHSIHFQYNFGSIALFYYLVVINIAELGGKFKKYALPFMAAASLILFISNVGSYTDNIRSYFNKREQNQLLDIVLEAIPENASVQASGYFVPKLSTRLELYDLRYNSELKTPNQTDYVVIDMRPGTEKDAAKFLKQFQDNGYKIVTIQENLISVLKK